MSGPLRVRSVRAAVYRVPAEAPVRTSFGLMRDRSAVLVRIEDTDGVVGLGEVWCNFPGCGAEHRARLVASVLAPLFEGVGFGGPPAAFAELTARTAVLAIQSGEPGPFAQAIAGIDIALWDLTARRAGKPLWKLLGGAAPAVRVYASGLNPDSPEKLAAARRAEGHAAFKLKIGFGADRDIANLKALRAALGEEVELMADANQAWDSAQARALAPALEPFRLRWLEEPIRADRPWDEWRSLAQTCDIPLAAGENLAGKDAFDAALASSALGVIQPDIAKWGGFSGCLAVAKRIRAAGKRYCPHYLGAGIGLLASAHLLAAAGGDGLLEVDANPNPLRTDLCGPLSRVVEGCTTLDSAPGLGIDLDSELLLRLERYRVPVTG